MLGDVGARAYPAVVVHPRPDVPRSSTSAVFARREADRAAYAEHLEQVRRYTYRVGVHRGRWRIVRRGAGGRTVLEDALVAFPDIDPGAERTRVAKWVAEVLGVRTAWLWRDPAHPHVYDLDVKS